jgi:hypothetical protein
MNIICKEYCKVSTLVVVNLSQIQFYGDINLNQSPYYLIYNLTL